VESVFETVQGRLRSAFDRVASGTDPVLRPSDRCDFQANGALALAKALGRNPREVATDVAAQAELAGIATIEVSGPGFLNVTLEPAYLGARLVGLATSERLGVDPVDLPRTVVVDYSAPNVAKEMHVGHLRSTVIGDSLRRLYEFAGHRVIARNHVGDWGTPFGMLIEHLLDTGEQDVLAALSIGDLDAFYVAARKKFDASGDFRERSRERVVRLQAGDAETRRLWRVLVDVSINYFDEVYRKLGVELTASDVYGESAYNDALAGVVTELDRLGLLVESDGARCVFPAGFKRRDNEPLPLIVQKSDGGFGYAATDLAAVRDRVDRLRADEILYVVGAPQALHLEMVLATARLANWLPPSVRVKHVAFGMVLGKDRKLLRSRLGGNAKLLELLDEAIDRADSSLRQRDPDLDGDERRTLAAQIARAAIKYADLSNELQHDYVFDLDRMTAFEGDTGPYLAYAHARVRSIFRRLEGPWGFPTRFALAEPAERDLAIAILRFPEAVTAATEQLAPHRLCGYLLGLAQQFTAFYEQCPVLAAPEPTRDERLALCDLTARSLKLGLGLLGIEAPERM
jgi:arginyl-tRNA synthetase